jgi:hypothetical protein
MPQSEHSRESDYVPASADDIAANERGLRVIGTLNNPIDVKKLARAIIEVAKGQQG